MKTIIYGFSEKITITIFRLFGTMEMFYIFFLFGLVAFYPYSTKEMKEFVAVFSSWVQLWSLPLVAVGTAIMSRYAEERSEQDHETIQMQYQMQEKEMMYDAQMREFWIERQRREDENFERIEDVLQRLESIEKRLG